MIKVIMTTWKSFMPISFAIFILSVSYGNFHSKIAFNNKAFAADIDPKANSILQEMSYYLGSKSKYSFKADIMFDDTLPSGQRLQISATEEVFVHKSDKVLINYISDVSSIKFWYDGNYVTLLDRNSNLYSQVAVSKSIDQVFDELLKLYEYSLPLPAGIIEPV